MGLAAVGAAFLACSLAGTRGVGGLQAGEPEPSAQTIQKLANLKLEDLLHTEVTVASRRPELLFETAAAVSVITGDDLRRSGVRTLAEALRMAPGLDVAQMDANTWAISPRGFAGLFSDKSLGLMDGRVLYSPYSSGVFWDIQQYLLEDVDRIEVVRGPGGSTWGANAVNGVIDIVTKDAKDTQGGFLTGGVGTPERGFVGARYGFQLSANGYGRLYAMASDRDHFPQGVDEGQFLKGGFRSDWHQAKNHFTFQGDYLYSTSPFRVQYPSLDAFAKYGLGAPYGRDVERSAAGNGLARFTHRFNDESELEVQTFFDHVERKWIGTPTVVDTWDIELKHRLPLPWRQSLMYGGGYRVYTDSVQAGPWTYSDPAHRTPQVANAFVQDQVDLVEKKLRLTLGTKVEHHDFTGWELEPSGRLAWFITPRQTAWAAVSRAVQVPARGIRDNVFPIFPITTLPFYLPPPPPYTNDVPLLFGTAGPQGRQTVSQKLMAYELGYRLEVTDRLSFDLVSFYNFYSDFLITVLSPGPDFRTTPFPHYLWIAGAGNGGKAETYGGELSAEWRVADWWRLVGSYSLLKEHLDDTVATLSLFTRGRDPMQQASLRSSIDLPANVSLDSALRYVDRLPAFGVRGYFNLSVRLAWRPSRGLEVALVGQNLLAPRHVEFGQESYILTQVTPVPRGGYLQVSYRW